MNSTLEVFNIGKKYKNRPVLRNVSLNVRRGEAAVKDFRLKKWESIL